MTKEVSTHHPHNYRADIDGLRALAVLLVLGYHVFPKVVRGGYIGVDIFFVISGYLITGIILGGLKSGTFSLTTFFVRRIKRIFPVLLTVVVSTYIAGWFLFLPKEFMELSKHIVGGVGFVANFTLWQDSGYFDSLPELKPLMHLWSLSIEEQFYLLWPVGLMFAWKYRLKLKPIFFGIFFISFLLNIAFISKKADAVFYFPFFRFWELLVGAILALYLSDAIFELDKKYQNYLSWLGLLLIGVATISLNRYSVFPGWWALCPTIGTALILWCKDGWININIFSNKKVIGVGLISYSLYLWHWPVISFMYVTYQDLPYYLDKLIIIVLSFLLSWLSYRFIENPIRLSKSTKRIVVVLCCLSLLVGVIGFATFKMKGIPERISRVGNDKEIPADLQDMLSPDYGGYISQEWREHRCFLAKEESAAQYKGECLEEKRPLVFLWGDSHAAALYKGLKDLQEKRGFGIAQFNASACPPLIHWQGAINKLCREINDHNLQLIKKVRPEIVILAAAWYWEEYEWKKVTQTIDELKKIGIAKIIIMGPVPNWKEKVPANIISYYRKFNSLPPKYTEFGLDVEQIKKVETSLEELSREAGVTYISIYQTLCTEDGCLLSTDGSIKNVTSLDHGHLSAFASRFVIEENAEKLFGDLK